MAVAQREFIAGSSDGYECRGQRTITVAPLGSRAGRPCYGGLLPWHGRLARDRRDVRGRDAVAALITEARMLYAKDTAVADLTQTIFARR